MQEIIDASPVSIAPAVDTALAAQDEIITIREQTESNFLELGKRLDDFIARDLHVAMEYRTVNEWLDSRALGIGRSMGWQLIEVWRTFGKSDRVDSQKLARAGHVKLAITASQIGKHPNVPDVEAAVEYAAEYSKRELVREFKQERPHTEKVICPTCGTKVKAEVLG